MTHQSKFESDRKIDTIRDDIFERYAPLADLVRERFPNESRGEDALRYALELYLRALPNLDAPVDGWTFLRVVEETPNSLRAVGIGYVLPSSQLPIDAEFHLSGGAVDYRVLVGVDNELWASLSDSRRWKAVYAYATEGVAPKWDWAGPVVGSLDE